MKVLCIWLILMCSAVFVSAQDHVGTKQEQARCLYAVKQMIKVANEALESPQSRPERTEKRRVLVEEWEYRLTTGEDPCVIYMDIQKAATTF